MKKLISSCALLMTLLTSQASYGVVGLATDSSATTIAGLALMDLSQIWIVDSSTTYRRNGRRGGVTRTSYFTFRVITYPAFLVAGLILLDDNGRADLSSELSLEQIQKAELSDEEVMAFKNEIEEINAIKDLITDETAVIEDDQERFEAAGQLWTEYAGALSKDAAFALSKLSQI